MVVCYASERNITLYIDVLESSSQNPKNAVFAACSMDQSIPAFSHK